MPQDEDPSSVDGLLARRRRGESIVRKALFATTVLMSLILPILILTLGQFVLPGVVPLQPRIAPRVMVFSMWTPEAQVWHTNLATTPLGNLTSIPMPIPGLSPFYPNIHCTRDKKLCHLTVGEGEINAAVSTTALVLSPFFDLRKTYFMLAGIAGVNPRHGTLGSVAVARFAVQVALQYEIDARSMPKGWSTGYVAYGTKKPLEYPKVTYGTEVFELNEQLQEVAFALASKATLVDDHIPNTYRQRYSGLGAAYHMAVRPPSVIKGDTATSDVYYSGKLLSEAFENTTTVWTNGTGKYCMSAQEDNAILEGLLRGAVQELVDFGRIIVLRAGSNFDRPPPHMTDYEHLMVADQNGFEIAMANLYYAGIEIIHGILEDWDIVFKQGVKAQNYIGDIWGTLGGTPNFGLGSNGMNDRRDAGR